jgi:hypothetical protein
VLVSPLNRGLGHATRDIPIIRSLLAHGHEVTLAACGSALSVLRHEFPDCRWIEYPDYPVPSGSGHLFIPKFCATLPFLFQATVREHTTLEAILVKDRYDLIISDNRPGVCSSEIPSIFVTHQLHYHLPLLYWPVECLGILANQNLHERYDRIIVPDNSPGPLSLAGKLSKPQTDVARERVFFSGILSDTRQIACSQDLDYLVVISGPEPQRTAFEKLIGREIGRLDGHGVILQGNPQKKAKPVTEGNWTSISYAPTELKVELMNRAQCVICRPGYTTMMELAELGKKRALLVPTPGEKGQKYLSGYYEENGWYHSCDQADLDLAEEIPLTRRYQGFPDMPKTADNIRRLYDELLAGYLE